ncbi:hypothetical protein HanRHA438_Chr05g0213831 [Helianthus annuus]|uniref:Uncharacterized protein n=1 Tax=Helianthus annuus TaxID=4232 RepID=A0A9K3IZL7_HELAN|nr:hypothetical protein HanXRQr2_Chr05g0203961 [Helianthus annuus]KAJ0918110.1 hypothetical protein HanRHA438_Chr05g0213831 [Helianthus annuus]KAJ0921875.1 hypothetical protein HanPSC8_Chr05g0196801 [Helianthus annuus]
MFLNGPFRYCFGKEFLGILVVNTHDRMHLIGFRLFNLWQILMIIIGQFQKDDIIIFQFALIFWSWRAHYLPFTRWSF